MRGLFILVFPVIFMIVFGVKIALAVYVYRNAERYNMDKVLWLLLVIFLPSILGLILFLIVRSGSRPRNICSWCGKEVNGEFVNCPYCGATLSSKCSQCGRRVEADWSVCPYCSNRLK